MKELSKANRRRAKKLMELAPDKFMSFMTNAAHNVMKGNLELDPECYKGLREETENARCRTGKKQERAKT